jgi:spore maturation protein CgeB
MNIVIVGLSISSSWGNGHATTYRSLARALALRGHEVLFLERDAEWYANNRDLPKPVFCELGLYKSLRDLKLRFSARVRSADLVMFGSYVAEGVPVGAWIIRNAQGVVAFYDIDTPVTLTKLQRGDYEYLSPELIPKFDLYLSFTGGPLLDRLRLTFGARTVRPLYCSADPEIYYPELFEKRWDIGYLGTYSADRHHSFQRLFLTPATMYAAGRFIVAGSQYPLEINWPPNVQRVTHLPCGEHRLFYNLQRFTLNITRGPMVDAGFSPSVRLFEAAACGTTIITDRWNGLEAFFRPGKEIIVAGSASEVLNDISSMPDSRRNEIGRAAYQRFLREHTPGHRAKELEDYVRELQARAAA